MIQVSQLRILIKALISKHALKRPRKESKLIHELLIQCTTVEPCTALSSKKNPFLDASWPSFGISPAKHAFIHLEGLFKAQERCHDVDILHPIKNTVGL